MNVNEKNDLNKNKVTAVTINTRPIALHSRRSNLSLVDVNQRKVVNIVFKIPTGFRTILATRNSIFFNNQIRSQLQF